MICLRFIKHKTVSETVRVITNKYSELRQIQKREQRAWKNKNKQDTESALKSKGLGKGKMGNSQTTIQTNHNLELQANSKTSNTEKSMCFFYSDQTENRKCSRRKVLEFGGGCPLVVWRGRDQAGCYTSHFFSLSLEFIKIKRFGHVPRNQKVQSPLIWRQCHSEKCNKCYKDLTPETPSIHVI